MISIFLLTQGFDSKELNTNFKTVLPISGYAQDQFKPFDDVIINFMQKRGFKGATLAIIYDNELVVSRGYGFSDKEQTKVIKPDAYMRIASLSKILTAIAIKKLIEQNKLKLETKTLDVLNQFKNIKDERIKDITIKNLLEHTGGWDKTISYDPLFSMDFISEKLDKKEDLTPENIINYVFENTSLDFAPGRNNAYSNFGYLILGRIIEKATGKKYIDYIKEICKSLDINIEQAYNSLTKRHSKEVQWYWSNLETDSSVFILPAADSAFGLLTSAKDLCKLLNNYWIDGEKKEANEKRSSWLAGSLPGLTTLARQRISNASIVLFINGRDDNNWAQDNKALKNEIDNVANKCGL